jgi:hypothetical protein
MLNPSLSACTSALAAAAQHSSRQVRLTGTTDSHTELLDPRRGREWPLRCSLFQQFIERRVLRVHLRSFNGLEHDIGGSEVRWVRLAAVTSQS